MKPLSIIMTVVLETSLCACHRQSGSDVLDNQSLASTSSRPEDRFGESFGKAFRADPKSKPVEVKPGDLPPVSLTAEPIPID